MTAGEECDDNNS